MSALYSEYPTPHRSLREETDRERERLCHKGKRDKGMLGVGVAAHSPMKSSGCMRFQSQTSMWRVVGSPLYILMSNCSFQSGSRHRLTTCHPQRGGRRERE